MAISDKETATWREPDLRELCDAHEPETQRLEFKQQLAFRTESEKSEAENCKHVGFNRVAALGGTASSAQLFELLAARGVETVTLALDADEAGAAATIAAVEAACRSAASPALEGGAPHRSK